MWLPSSSRSPRKYPDMGSGLWDTGTDGISLTSQEEGKMDNITHPAFWQCLLSDGDGGKGMEGVQCTHFFIDWILLACKEAWPNEGESP